MGHLKLEGLLDVRMPMFEMGTGISKPAILSYILVFSLLSLNKIDELI
jgi:hypothetical protein